jgi:hypothetical protein
MKDADCEQKLQAGEKLLQGIEESSDGFREQYLDYHKATNLAWNVHNHAHKKDWGGGAL